MEDGDGDGDERMEVEGERGEVMMGRERRVQAEEGEGEQMAGKEAVGKRVREMRREEGGREGRAQEKEVEEKVGRSMEDGSQGEREDISEGSDPKPEPWMVRRVPGV